ncbi:hypothetical protein ACQPYE_21035 [Actinosynnema sp. CA-299493]
MTPVVSDLPPTSAGSPAADDRLPALAQEIVGSLLRPTGVRFELDHLRAVPVVDNDPESTAMLQRADRGPRRARRPEPAAGTEPGMTRVRALAITTQR